MPSTDAGTPAAGDGKPPAERPARRGLRDSTLGRIALLVLVLVAALAVARTCGSADRNVSQEEAIEIAKDNAAFEPCAQATCVQVRYVQRGIPVRAYWGVVLSHRLDEDGRPNRIESFLIDVTTGAVSRPR
jgi:hypothetical protein